MTSDTLYEVVQNDEEQYALWPSAKPLPAGWRQAGMRGAKQACLDFVNQVWTDMRPLSLRRQQGADATGESEHGQSI